MGAALLRLSFSAARTAAPPHSGTVTASDGVQLAYARWCVAGGGTPTIVLVHGWSGSRRYFDGVVPLLLARGLDVLAYDHRFHGESGPQRPDASTGDTPPGAHVARLAVDLETILSTLDIHDATAIGSSMGPAILWSYAELYGRGRVARGVYVDQAPLQNRVPGWTLGCWGGGDSAEFAAGNADAWLAGEVAMEEGVLALLSSKTLAPTATVWPP